MRKNILLNTDSYKVGMWSMYPPETQNVFSYIESRGGKHRDLVFFGLQAFIKEYLLQPITMSDVEEAVGIWEAHGLNVNADNLRKIVTKHNGFLPLRISAVEEGTVVPTGNVMVTVEATDEEFYWLPTWIETSLLRAIWYPTTVASNSREIKKVIAKYMRMTGADMNGLPFKLHDFGARGTQSNESAEIGGAAHLINFMGTDTIAGVRAAMHYYGADVWGFSIPATEHSISTAWGRGEGEVEYVRNNIRATEGFPIFANVADTYDVFQFVDMLGTTLKDEIVALGETGRTMVVRPDSGNPVDVPIQVIERLMDHFGCVKNRMGYKVLPPYIRVIQGDGIDADTVEEILDKLYVRGISADNIAFGMGGKLLGSPQRDDQKFAMKASAIKIAGEWVGIVKDPITDPGKKSKKGRLTLVRNRGLGSNGVQTVEEQFVNGREVLLKPIYIDGKMANTVKFDKVRQNAAIPDHF